MLVDRSSNPVDMHCCKVPESPPARLDGRRVVLNVALGEGLLVLFKLQVGR